MPFSDEAGYFGRRAIASRLASDSAADSGARIAHSKLAIRYQHLSDRHGSADANANPTNEEGHI
ncbi:hypothetical protein [Sphingomonas sp. 37zxx]|uniref:hypothetical protein n=1 Tax=Sphingomonas sp. 37zxx TaxID=1550073 RepID=UPI00053BFA7E|nr:hypothetical protein [Sphingomonas sp. 37zxx]